MTDGEAGDGIGGTDGSRPDNVTPLFTDRVTAAGLPPSPDVVKALEIMLRDAQDGKITSLAAVAFTPEGNFFNGTWGKGPYTGLIGGLEDLKFKIIHTQLLRLELGK